jgi:hypothetical protein
MRTTSIVVGVALIGTCLDLRAQDAPNPGPARPGTTGSAAGTSKHADDEKVIAALAAAYAKAFNANDAAAAAATFAEDAPTLTAEGDQAGALVGQVAWKDTIDFAFRLVGGPSNDPALKFAR